MNAITLAKRTREAELNNAKALWEEIQQKLLEQLARQADNRCWKLHIDRNNDINKHDILFYTPVREYWVAELEKMQFKCEWKYDAEYKDSSELIISWEHLREA